MRFGSSVSVREEGWGGAGGIGGGSGTGRAGSMWGWGRGAGRRAGGEGEGGIGRWVSSVGLLSARGWNYIIAQIERITQTSEFEEVGFGYLLALFDFLRFSFLK